MPQVTGSSNEFASVVGSVEVDADPERRSSSSSDGSHSGDDSGSKEEGG